MRTTLAVIASLLVCVGAGVTQSAESGPSLQPTNRNPNVATVIGKALHFLKETQNRDGSWSKGPESCSATALALSALLRIGETKTSVNFGKTITLARDWLLAAHPESLNDRMAIAVALSDYNTLHAEISVAQRVTAILQKIDEPGTNIWADILCTTRLPDESQRPKWCLTPKQVQQKYVVSAANTPPETKADYLKTYVVGRAKFRADSKTAAAHYHYLTNEVLSRQQVDGSFPVSASEDKVAATALVLLSLADLHHGSNQFCPPPPPRQEESGDAEVKVTL